MTQQNSNIICSKCNQKMRVACAELFFDNKNGNQFVEVHYVCHPDFEEGCTCVKIIRYTLNGPCVRSHDDWTSAIKDKPCYDNRDLIFLTPDKEALVPNVTTDPNDYYPPGG